MNPKKREKKGKKKRGEGEKRGWKSAAFWPFACGESRPRRRNNSKKEKEAYPDFILICI